MTLTFDQPFFTGDMLEPFRVINTPLNVQMTLDDLPQLEPVQTLKEQ